jgi:hypothetical protein
MAGARKRLYSILAPWLLPGVLLAVLVGCINESEEPQRNSPPFPHKRHVKDEDMECTACHKKDKTGNYGMPNIKSCNKCHESIDEKKAPQKRVSAFLVDGQPVWSHVTAFTEDVKFSHQVHGEDKIQCATCHQGLENSKKVTSKLRLDMQACLECHAHQHVGQAVDNCAFCHTYIDKHWMPPNHERDWKFLHGRAAANAPKTGSDSCSLCHTQTTCTACHRVEQPRSHNNFWRERGHGLTAQVNRNACKTCHTDDYCIRCHQHVTPQSHTGNWDNQHCLNCHLPLKNTPCLACHKNANSHAALAPPLPNNKIHQQATPNTCITCHAFGQNLMNHPNNGDNCLLCHKR